MPDAFLYDISPPLSPALALWPGDTPVSREVLLDMQRGDNITLSSLRATVHLGAHADGPNHYGKDAPAIDERSLDYYLGPCQVVCANVASGRRVGARDLEFKVTDLKSEISDSKSQISDHESGITLKSGHSDLQSEISDLKAQIKAPRLLIATSTFPDPNRWNPDFAGLEPALIDALHDVGVITVGIDTPSVDLFESKGLPAHARFLANDMAILEGLVLKDVPPGVYELIALPLKLVGFDASPVRAVLRELPATH